MSYNKIKTIERSQKSSSIWLIMSDHKELLIIFLHNFGVSFYLNEQLL